MVHRIPRFHGVFYTVLITVVELAVLVDCAVTVGVAEGIGRLVLSQGASALALLVWEQEATICVVISSSFVVD